MRPALYSSLHSSKPRASNLLSVEARHFQNDGPQMDIIQGESRGLPLGFEPSKYASGSVLVTTIIQSGVDKTMRSKS